MIPGYRGPSAGPLEDLRCLPQAATAPQVRPAAVAIETDSGKGNRY